MIPCQLRPSSPTECGDNEEGDDAATEAPTMFGNETVVDPNEMEQNWYASRMQEVEEEWEWVKEEKVQKDAQLLAKIPVVSIGFHWIPMLPNSRGIILIWIVLGPWIVHWGFVFSQEYEALKKAAKAQLKFCSSTSCQF